MSAEHSPAYLGWAYTEALAAARKEDRAPDRVQVTRPPYPCSGSGRLRLVAERDRDGRREWILAYEHYQRLPKAEPRPARAG